MRERAYVDFAHGTLLFAQKEKTGNMSNISLRSPVIVCDAGMKETMQSKETKNIYERLIRGQRRLQTPFLPGIIISEP
jgi:hypothetical protein